MQIRTVLGDDVIFFANPTVALKMIKSNTNPSTQKQFFSVLPRYLLKAMLLLQSLLWFEAESKQERLKSLGS